MMKVKCVFKKGHFALSVWRGKRVLAGVGGHYANTSKTRYASVFADVGDRMYHRYWMKKKEQSCV